MTCRIESDMKRPIKLFEFDVFVYPADKSPDYMKVRFMKVRASNEHAARRKAVLQCLANNRCVYSIEMIDTHADGGPPGRA